MQSLSIPDCVWEDISLDFTSGLPRSDSLDCILVVVDHLSNYGHFIGVKHHFTARAITQVFVKEIVHLHKIFRSIVFYQDLVYISLFRKELFKLAGTTLKMSSAYHPETDGHTKVLNRCLETYLHCFTADRPTGVNGCRGLNFAIIRVFSQVLEGCHLRQFMGDLHHPLGSFRMGKVHVQTMVEVGDRDEILRHLRFHLEKAEQRMVLKANKHR